MLPQKMFKIRIINLATNEFQTTKFPNFKNSVANSLTFQVFQVSGNPEKIPSNFRQLKVGF